MFIIIREKLFSIYFLKNTFFKCLSPLRLGWSIHWVQFSMTRSRISTGTNYRKHEANIVLKGTNWLQSHSKYVIFSINQGKIWSFRHCPTFRTGFLSSITRLKWSNLFFFGRAGKFKQCNSLLECEVVTLQSWVEIKFKTLERLVGFMPNRIVFYFFANVYKFVVHFRTHFSYEKILNNSFNKFLHTLKVKK